MAATFSVMAASACGMPDVSARAGERELPTDATTQRGPAVETSPRQD